MQDLPYDKDDDVIKATSFEVISTIRDVLQRSSLWRDHVQTYTKVRLNIEHMNQFIYLNFLYWELVLGRGLITEYSFLLLFSME